MAVKFTKPEVKVRDDLHSSVKVTGVAGEALLRASTPQEQFRMIGAGRKNLLINGDMKVAQRATSKALSGSVDGYRTIDRWRVNITSSTDQFEATNLQSTDAPPGFAFSNKLTVTQAETSLDSDERVDIEQRIEAQDLQHLNYGTADARSMTLSFWCKSNIAGIYSINYRAHDMGDSYVTPYEINKKDTWEHKTVHIKGNNLSGSIVNDTGIGIWLRFMLLVSSGDRNDSFTNHWVNSSTSSWGPTNMQDRWGMAAGDYFAVTGVQLEVGDVATPFEHRSFGEELSLCQRYFQKSTQQGVFPENGSTTTSFSSQTNDRNLVPVAIWSHPTYIQFPVEMRSNPQMTRYGNSQGYWGYLTTGTSAPSGISAHNFHSNVYIGGTSKGVYVNNQVSTNPLWGVSGHWEADAEI